MNFTDYLKSKRIDSDAFLRAEPERWKTWNAEFDQVHPNSFTAQKLYLINPLRRKYLLKQVLKEDVVAEQKPPEQTGEGTENKAPAANIEQPANPKPAVPRPVFKPKPKIS